MHVAFKHTLYGFQHNRSLRYYNIQNTIDSYASTTIHSIVRSAGSGNTHKRTEANLGRGKKVAENFFLANDNKTAVSLLRINNKSGRHLLKKAHDEKQAEAFYLFTDEREKQLLIVSGDERMQRILGYTDRPLAGNAIPDGLADLLDGYTAQYNALGNAASSAATTPTRSALYIGITPVKAEKAAPLQLDCEGKYEGFYSTLTSLKVGEKQSMHLSALSALSTWRGKLQWNLCKADGSVVESLGSKQIGLHQSCRPETA